MINEQDPVMRGLFGIAAWLFATCFLTFLHPLTQPLSLLNCQAVPFFDRGGLTHRQFSRQIDSFMLVGGLLPRFAHVRVYLAWTSTSRTSRILSCLCDPPAPSALWEESFFALHGATRAEAMHRLAKWARDGLHLASYPCTSNLHQ